LVNGVYVDIERIAFPLLHTHLIGLSGTIEKKSDEAADGAKRKLHFAKRLSF
jgi:hypothetical protein